MSETNESPQATLATAVALAEEFEAIRSCYGDECLSFVKRALLSAEEKPWDGVVVAAMTEWHRAHPRFSLDMNL